MEEDSANMTPKEQEALYYQELMKSYADRAEKKAREIIFALEI